ncbi:MAG: DNA gyrase inhibitor YacG [Rhodospirillaceae bacterium]|nr:DNA gyrase inhibitor YacG [Rhodospirillaceae bacterium]
MAPKCVRCGKPVEPRHRPFCSQRCADIDLGMWATGGYRIATDDQALGDDDGEETGPATKT